MMQMHESHSHMVVVSHTPILQNNIILVAFIPRHYAKFYVKVITDDLANSSMLNVVINILIINK